MAAKFKRPRKILSPPIIKGFKPFGGNSSGNTGEPVMLLYEEYEALRLCDYDMLTHHQAAVIMNVSRPTFTRIYASVRKKIALAFAEGRQIIIEGGKVYFDTEWYHCHSCGCYFNHTDMHSEASNCPLCGSNKIADVGEDTIPNNESSTDQDQCICPSCGYTTLHIPGSPCSHQTCPDCNTRMKRNKVHACRH